MTINKKFGVSYNVFDGEELLKDSILSIRDNVDYVSVVYQKESNYGNTCSENLEEILYDLVDNKLIDRLYNYKPKLNLTPHFNEVLKRNIGYFISQKEGMDYHMTMDCDEFFINNEFINMKRRYVEDNLDSGYCQMLTYYKTKEYILDPPEDYYISLFYRISNYNNYFFQANTPVTVDPTRKMNSGKFKIFDRNEIQMHHMSYIRNDINKKFQNSSAKVNFKDIDLVLNHYNNWKNGQDAIMLGSVAKTYKTKKVNYFL